jgi:hypothetical protein
MKPKKSESDCCPNVLCFLAAVGALTILAVVVIPTINYVMRINTALVRLDNVQKCLQDARMTKLPDKDAYIEEADYCLRVNFMEKL